MPLLGYRDATEIWQVGHTGHGIVHDNVTGPLLGGQGQVVVPQMSLPGHRNSIGTQSFVSRDCVVFPAFGGMSQSL